MLSVTLTAKDGVGTGTLTGHPAGVVVRTRRLPEGRLSVSLWDKGTQIGEGVLTARGKAWGGTCSEFAGSWFVTGTIGSGVLQFAEAAKAAE